MRWRARPRPQARVVKVPGKELMVPWVVGSPIGFRYQLGLPGYLRELYCESLENKLVGWVKMVMYGYILYLRQPVIFVGA